MLDPRVLDDVVCDRVPVLTGEVTSTTRARVREHVTPSEWHETDRESGRREEWWMKLAVARSLRRVRDDRRSRRAFVLGPTASAQRDLRLLIASPPRPPGVGAWAGSTAPIGSVDSFEVSQCLGDRSQAHTGL